MKPRFLMNESLHALQTNLLRSVLTIIGIVVGIFSVTAMLALGEGLSANISNRLSSFSQGDITITGDFTQNDLNWLSSRPYAAHLLATEQLPSPKVVAYQNSYSPSVQSVLGDYQDMFKYTVVAGSVFDFTDQNLSDNVAVVSNGFNDVVTTNTGRSVLNQPILINGQSFNVIGIITSNSLSYTRGDGLVLIPHKAMIGNLVNTQDFSSAAMLLKDSGYYDPAGKDVLEGLNASRQLASTSKDIFNVQTAESFIQTAEQTTASITLFLGIVGGIALFVGGIGTMNMMLTTVTERTKEIGLRKAIGARDRDILLQILIESVILTTVGGAIGIALTLIGANIANKLLAGNQSISVLVDGKVIAAAFIVSFLVGIVFGLYPARNASKLQPVDALRTE